MIKLQTAADVSSEAHNTRMFIQRIFGYRRFAVIRKLARRRIILVFILIAIAVIWSLSLIFQPTYVKLESTDFPNIGDFRCPGSGSVAVDLCTFSAGRENLKSFGKRKCNALKGKCIGFVANEGSKTVTLKNHFYGHGSFAIGVSTFIMEIHTFLVNFTGQMITACADPLETESIRQSQIGSIKKRCKLPDLDAFDKTIMSAMFIPPKLTCPGRKHFSFYQHGKLRLNQQSKVSEAKWNVIKVKPGRGAQYEFSSSGKLNSDTPEVTINEDMIRVDVTSATGDTQTDFFIDIAPKPDVLKRPNKAGINLNIMIIGLDSTSHSHFQRKLGKVYKYLKEEMNSFMFDGYSIIGDGTTAALIGLLTGKKEEQLPEGRYRMPGAKCLDNWPWIFKNFKEHGFATMYSEDEVDLGAFTYRLMGFCDPPMDHYMLPYWFSAIDGLSNAPWYKFGSKSLRGHCIGFQPIHNVSLNIVKSMLRAYPKTPAFGLSFLSDICHNQLNGLSLVEDDLYMFLKDMKEQHYLNNTMLVMLGDHGVRFGSIRSTVIGKMEERLPFLSISLPGWFEKSYPNYVNNLRQNIKVVTSPLDLHATFAHILSHPSLPKNFGLGKSLFTNVGDRTCREAGIPTHFCPCMESIIVDVKHKHIKKGAEDIVRHINDLILREHLSDKCALLAVKEIRSAVKIMPNEDVETYKGAGDIDGRTVLKGDKPKGICSYQLQLVTSPNDGMFEATVQVSALKTFVNPQMSRIDRYGDQPNCIKETHPHMREYCYCT